MNETNETKRDSPFSSQKMAAEGWYIYIYLRRHAEEDQHPPVGGRAESLPFHPYGSRCVLQPAAEMRRKGTVPFRTKMMAAAGWYIYICKDILEMLKKQH